MEGNVRHCNFCHGIAEGSVLLRDGVVNEFRDADEKDESHIDIIHLCGAHYEEVKKLLVRLRIQAA